MLRHWPVLFTLAFAGQAAHQLVMYGAIRATEVSGLLGYLVVVLVPMTTLTAILLMLRSVRASLPGVSAAVGGLTASDGRRDSVLDHVGSLLVPFLAVYTMSGYLIGDMLEYGGGVAEAAVTQGRFREFLPEGTVLIAVVAITFVLRWLQARWEGARRRAWLGVVGAYLEVIWITSVILLIASFKPWQWVAERRALHWLVDGWHGTVDRLGPVTGPADAVTEWLSSLWGSVAAVLAAPLAWFVVGAVAYGYRLAPVRAPNRPLYERVARGWSAIPRLPRKTLLAITNDIRGQNGTTSHAAKCAGAEPSLQSRTESAESATSGDTRRTELHTHARPYATRRLGDRVLPGALARAAHDDQVAVTKGEAQARPATTWTQLQRPR